MVINRSNIMSIINWEKVQPDKDYGQNFLVDPEVSDKIVDSLDIKEEDNVLEVGPGLGSLTHFLLEKSNKITVCDIDNRMIRFLRSTYDDELNYILEDIRKVDVSKYDKIISNLPYNITTEVVRYLLIEAINVKKMTLMCQQEAFNRFYDVSGKEYGPVSILIHLLGEVKKVMTLKPGYFYPAPKCNSLVFTFDYKPVTTRENAIGTYKLAKELFLNRRKTIYNNLKNYLHDENKAKEILAKLNIEVNKRPEDISPEVFLEMYKNTKVL